MTNEAGLEFENKTTNTGEFSPKHLFDQLQPEDCYIFCAVSGGKHENTMMLKRGDYVRVFKHILYQLLSELEDDCDYNLELSLRIAEDIIEEIMCKWLGENSLPHQK